MINNLPLSISIAFGLTTFLTIYVFSKAVVTTPNVSARTPQYKTVLGVLIGWSALQMAISWTGFYQKTDTLPPRILLAVAPTLLLIIALFFTENGKKIIGNLDLKTLTYLHIVRIPVELVLFFLFQNGQIPELMTFEGRNFDIFSGITAPFMAYFGFYKKALPPTIILIWNFICLALLINIVASAALSIESPLQQFGFEQPNRAILFFPFIWLPSVVVPLVLVAHLVVIKRLMEK
jgi:hypothetical protein